MKKSTHAVLAAVLAVVLAQRPAGAASANFARQLGDSIADAVERVMPSVVVIRTEATVYHAARNYLWGTVHRIPERLAGQGSGVIITDDGYVLTSLHVIAQAQEIEVVLDDGSIYAAIEVGRDIHTDLAVLKIQPAEQTTFTAVEWGDSDAVRIGEIAIAVGSPFSLSSSVTAGIVSQKGRSVGLLPYEDFIQTDAPINPGNSGGPLVDADGRMIGINAVIKTMGMNRGSVGIGFAVPSNLARHVGKSLIEHGVVERPWIGVRLAQVEPTSETLRSTNEYAVAVVDVIHGTPADKGGLRRGDLILTVDGEAVHDVRACQKLVLRREVGDAVEVTVRRGGQEFPLTLRTEDMPRLER